ncbi:DUF1858 domain-containing protein [Companilactobacillus ginsenosidimutans]|uniref:DUF1858 domain-containing protein n=1 Tax=Companilactobacillus ginsenosidimutans TaxID=1007676 RepID=A0A0H4QMU4_9LACO|nr:DUF1858 domain-containing protein [Companilactobacillus ginsenosidimutans]AKP68461.1 hypothetical protein ABM34_10080 [Companilactobacillus ginsenosidimutans]
MSDKVIDFEVPIHSLAEDYPDFVDIMYSIGFTKIKVPGMLNTVGKIINLKKGSRAMGIPLDSIARAFQERGYELKNYDE